MSNTLMQMLPLIGILIAGIVLKAAGVVGDKQSSWLLRLVFYGGLPLVVFLAIVRVRLDGGLLSLALLSPIVVSVTMVVGYFLRHSILHRTRPKTFASLLAGAMILNISILYPFVQAAYGAEGLARLAVVDCFNIIMIASVLFVVFAVIGHKKPNIGAIAYRVLMAPTLWAIIGGLIFKSSGASLPTQVMDIFEPAAVLASWVLLFAVGIRFKWRLKDPHLLIIQLLLRMGLGLIIGFVVVKLFDVHGLNAEIILIASAAPIGLNSITLAEIEKLDVEYAVSAVSAGLVVGIITIPFIIHFVQIVNR
jgi:predicted permease